MGGKGLFLWKEYMTDILDTTRLEKLDQKEKDKRKREINDLKKLLSMPEYRRLLWRIWGEAGVYNDSFTGNSQTFYNEGRKSIGLWMLREAIAADPQAFAQIQSEYISELNSQKEEE